MANLLALGRLLGYSDFFPNDPPHAKEHYAKKIGSRRINEFCCHFLGFFRHNAIPDNESLLAEWFTFYGFDYFQSPSYNYVHDEYKRIIRFHPDERLIMISVESLLNLFLWLQGREDIPGDVAQEDASHTIELFRLYMTFNDEVLVRYEKASSSAKTPEDDRKLQRLILAMSFPQNDLLNIDYSQLLYCQFYKAIRLLDFISVNVPYQLLYKKLLAEFNCENKEEFLKRVGLAAVLSVKGGPGWNTLVVEKNADYDKATIFLEKLCVTPSPDIEDLQDDYLELRSNPLQKIKDGEYRIIFDLFMIKKVYNGLFFLLSSYATADPALFKGNFPGTFRIDFSEAVIVYDVLDKVFIGPGIIKITGAQFTDAGIEREPDYYVRDNKSIALFESKDFFMRGEKKLSYDFAVIEGELMKDGRLIKAVNQLIRNVERIILSELKLDKGYNIQEIEIFPIIITHDSLYDAAALNYWVHYWFKDALEPIKKKPELKDFDFNRVAPVTILDIDTAILYQGHFQSGELNLFKLLREYHEFVEFNFDGSFESSRQIKRHAHKSAMSFSNFVRQRTRDLDIGLDMSELNQLLENYGIT